MGIQGLLPLLKSIHKPTHLRNFAGQTLGVDAYGWLHRGTVSCAIELAQGKPTRKHIEFTLNRVRMLIHFGVKPFLVFDGDYLPSKSHTEKERAARRKESKRTGLELLRMGRPSQAHLELQKAIDVTPLMARELIEELKQMDVPYIVAPYEADSQMAYLEKQGVISGIISEDSDLLVFGTKCLLTKLDQHGECVMINRADFTACREISLVGWSDKEFRMMAMLSGCDYLPGIDKMGLKTAYRLVRKHTNLDRIVRTVQFEGKMKVPAGYLEAFARAEHTFMYQWVFCPEAQCLVNLNKVPSGIDAEDMPYIGKHVEPEIATGVAAGDLDPNTKQRLPFISRPQHPALRSRTVSTPDEKQGKPISEFFKPRRTPLAELDPNSFTPSPSQQRLLQEQHTTSWSASQVPAARPSAISRVSTAPIPSSAPQASRRAVSTPYPATQRASPKRQRLCSDAFLANSMDGSVGMQSATSRFFSKQTAQPSPSLRKGSSQKKQDDFQLWSDDSNAEAAAELVATQEASAAAEADAEVAPSPKKRKKLAVFADAPPAANVSLEDQQRTTTAESQQAATTSASTVSQQSCAIHTPDTSFESQASQAAPSIFSKGSQASYEDFKTKFAFKPAVLGSPRTRSTPSASKKPLRAADHNAVNRAEVQDSPSPVKVIKTAAGPSQPEALVPNSSPITGHTLAPEEDGIEDEEWLAIERRDVSPGVTLAAKGSEDMLVPNSPTSGSDDGRLKPKIDFGRFAFAG